MTRSTNMSNSEDIISSNIREKRIKGFDLDSGVTYRREDISKKANSDNGIENYQTIDSTITESGVELEAGEKIFFCHMDKQINRLKDGFQCSRCKHLYYIGHLGYEEETGRIRTVEKTLRNGTTQSSQVHEKVRYCRHCWLIELSKRVLTAPFCWAFNMLASPLGHNTQEVNDFNQHNEDYENGAL